MSLQRIYVDYDFNKNQILNARLHPVTTFERTVLTSIYNSNDEGIIVYDLTDNVFYGWNGNDWFALGLSQDQLDSINAAIGNSIVGLTVDSDTTNIHFTLNRQNTSTVVGSIKVRHIHTQNQPAPVWTINHNLNCYPSINIVDSANSEVIGEVNYINQNTVELSFTAAFSGAAYLN